MKNNKTMISLLLFKHQHCVGVCHQVITGGLSYKNNFYIIVKNLKLANMKITRVGLGFCSLNINLVCQ